MTPRVHHAARRRGGRVAAGGAGAAAERMRRIGVLMHVGRGRSRNFRPASGRSCRGCSNWAGPIGRNVRIDIRWADGQCR